MFNRQQVTRLIALGCVGLGIAVTDGTLTQVKTAIANSEQHEIIDHSFGNETADKID